MLTSLAIHNLALVRMVELDLQSGLTSVSGETGAGKSLMIHALALVLGDKPRQLDDTHCQVSAEFSLERQSPAGDWLAERELLHNEPQQNITALIRRSITNNRSKAYINGVQVGVGELAQLGDVLLGMHSQHQHHALLRQANQRDMLDTFADARHLAREVAGLYARTGRLRKELAERNDKQRVARRELELVQHHLAELDALAPQQDEYARLDQEHRRASQKKHIQQLLADLLADLQGDGDRAGVTARVQRTIAQLTAMQLATNADLVEMLTNAAVLLEEAASEARVQIEHIPDQHEFALLEERIAEYHQLARKHHCRAEELADLHGRLRQQAEQLVAETKAPEKIATQLASSEQELQKKAEQLTRERSKAAIRLETMINGYLPQMAMADARFAVAFETHAAPTAAGYEQPAFMLQTNRGEKMRPLREIASGGELSRTSLALYLACSDHASPMVMVFDEVDAGLSSKVAARVGAILKKLSRHHQVICISHQAQIVALADQHLAVRKETTGDSVQVKVEVLESEGVVAEIARMLGGASETKGSTMQLARDLYTQGRGG